MSKVVDAFMFSGEFDLLEMRLNILAPHVDTFIIGESELSFAGKAKPLHFFNEQERFRPFFDKILYLPINSFYEPYVLKYFVPQCEATMNYPHRNAFYQKEYLQRGMMDLQDDDIVYFGDADEIWTPQEVEEEPAKLEQLMYANHLNRRSSEPWKGTAIATYKKVKQYGLNQIRLKATNTKKNGGSHFTNMGGYEAVKRKIETYDHQEINTEEIHAKLKERVENGQDFLGREITTWIDTKDWPLFLRENKGKYSHLCWNGLY
jgi:hypothetical protein